MIWDLFGRLQEEEEDMNLMTKNIHSNNLECIFFAIWLSLISNRSDELILNLLKMRDYFVRIYVYAILCIGANPRIIL